MGRIRVYAVLTAALVAVGIGATGLAIANSSSSQSSDVSSLLAQSAERLADPTDFSTSEGAIAFEPGVSYEEAVLRLRVAQASGNVDPAMSAVAPLPRGVVAVVPSDPSGAVIIDLAAPYGYDVALGAALSPTYALESVPSEGATKSSVGPWFEGSRLVIPGLPACMVSSGRSEPRPVCRADDKVIEKTTLALP